MNNKIFGGYGETVAAKYLVKNGYEILEKNFRTRFGEIDIIAKENDTLVFVEVKTRENDKFVSPFAAVGANKQKNIVKTSLFYLKAKNLFDKIKCRFDVMSIISDNGNNRVELIKDAFRI